MLTAPQIPAQMVKEAYDGLINPMSVDLWIRRDLWVLHSFLCGETGEEAFFVNMMRTARLFTMKLRRAKYDRMLEKAKAVSVETHRPLPLVLADVAWSSLYYGAAFSDYFIFTFYKKSRQERREYITLAKNNKFVGYMNDPADRHIFDSKAEFAKLYRDYLGRGTLDLKESTDAQVVDFLEEHPIFFAKKDNMFGGIGVERFHVHDHEEAVAAVANLRGRKFDILEEAIRQHPEMALFHPDSVNTVRVFTIRHGDEVDIVYTAIKAGNGGVVDNASGGGLMAAVDIDSGIVFTDALVKGGQYVAVHPLSGVAFKGFQIPMWDQLKAFVKKAALVTPRVRFVGWDVAITENGPVIVEGNFIPGYHLLQNPDRVGKMWIIRKYMK